MENKNYPYEDMIFKHAMETFGQSALTFLGIEGKIKSVSPTEMILLKPQTLLLDYVFEMMDNTLIHLEFQSTNKGIEDLRRFRVYEAQLSYQRKKEVSTYVVFTGDIKNPCYSLKNGKNYYLINIVTLADKDGDTILETIKKKVHLKRTIDEVEALELAFIPVMGGRKTKTEKIKEAIHITMALNFNKTYQRSIQTLLVAFANKFLSDDELASIEEDLKMTDLIKKFINEGLEQGLQEGKILTAKNLLGLLSEEVIAEKTDLPLEKIHELAMKKNSKAS